MHINGKMLGLVMLAGLAAPSLAQAKPASFFAPSPKLVMQINKSYGTDFRVPAPAQAQRQTHPRREAMIWQFWG